MPNEAKMAIAVPKWIKAVIKALFLKKSAINAPFCANSVYIIPFLRALANIYKQSPARK
jgi:hypothetical protein